MKLMSRGSETSNTTSEKSRLKSMCAATLWCWWSFWPD